MIIWQIMRQQMKLIPKMIKTYMKKQPRTTQITQQLSSNNYPVTEVPSN